MRLDFKLAKKGLLLVSVPLLFELLFVLTLIVLLQQERTAALHERHSKAIMVQTNSVVKLAYDSAVAMIFYALVKSDLFVARSDKVARQIPEELAQLKNLVDSDPNQQKNVQQFDRTMKDFLSLMSDVKQALINNRGTPDVFKLAALKRRITQGSGRLMEDAQQIIEEENRARRLDPITEEKAQFFVHVCIGIGIALNIVITIWLAQFFSKDIKQRLFSIVDNAERLVSGLPLRPAIKGVDEIAHLDSVFHDMAGLLQEAQRKERTMIENAVDVICYIDSNKLFVSVSPACERLWGYLPLELAGHPLREFVLKEDFDRTGKMLDKAREQKGSIVEFENQIKKKDGQLIDMLWSTSWSELDHSFSCIAHDMTERKNVERLKQDFVNMVSHDLRTPLGAMRAFLGMLSTGTYGKLTDQGLDKVRRLENAMVRLDNLISDMLDIEKMEAGKMELRLKVVSIGNVIDSALDLVRGLSDEQKINLQVDLQTNSEIVGDNDRLVQVVQNLLANAIKFSPVKGTVTVSTANVNHWVEVRVKDEGAGIPDVDQEPIFDRFKQASGEVNKPRSGTGLGLAICKAIIEQHGGVIGVESQLGKGSTFWFRIPI